MYHQKMLDIKMEKTSPVQIGIQEAVVASTAPIDPLCPQQLVIGLVTFCSSAPLHDSATEVFSSHTQFTPDMDKYHLYCHISRIFPIPRALATLKRSTNRIVDFSRSSLARLDSQLLLYHSMDVYIG